MLTWQTVDFDIVFCDRDNAVQSEVQTADGEHNDDDVSMT